jgi:hypothetical protein
MEEKPTVALREKPNCSIVRCWQLMASRDVQAVVSAGHTGAVVAAGLRTRLFLKGVKRPGIAVRLPTVNGSCILIDVGANPAARPEHLAQYGLMGSVWAKEMLGIESPRIGLMNIGSEEGKGTDLYRDTHTMLANSKLHGTYIGNVEGRGLYHGEADVIVCEGFVGNVVLKVSEGMAEFILKTVGGAMMKALSTERDLAKQTLGKLTDQFHYQESGGALKAWHSWHAPTNDGNEPDIQAPNQGSTETGRFRTLPPKRVGRAVGRVPSRGASSTPPGGGTRPSTLAAASERAAAPVLFSIGDRVGNRNVTYQIFARCSIGRYIGVPSRIPNAS